MKTLNDECVLVNRLRDEDVDRIVTVGNEKECKHIINCLLDDKNFKCWVENSGKSDPPPDYYSDQFNLMMEIMRVDDCAYVNSKNKVVNKTLQAENLIIQEIRNKFPEFNNSNFTIITNSNSGLETFEDHNYKRYYENFNRVIKKHKESIPIYKKNHPNHKLIFYVYDESTAYIEVANESSVKPNYQYQELIFAERLHEFYLDNRFTEVIRNCGADYVIWYAPNKYVNAKDVGLLDIPKVIVYEVKAINCESEFKYNENLMISCEM